MDVLLLLPEGYLKYEKRLVFKNKTNFTILSIQKYDFVFYD